MDPRLIDYYNRELQYIREMGGEFASEFPKIAGRLGLDGFECADPYVERLLEGFGFLAARIQLKIDAEFPKFTQHLLEMVYPHYLAPTPSMAVVQFQPDQSESTLADGLNLPRDSVLRSILGKGDQTSCQYRTAHDVTLWPLQLAEVDYFSRDVAGIDVPDLKGVKAGIRLRLRTTAGLTFDKLALETLPLYLRGSGELRMLIYEQLFSSLVAMVIQPTQRPVPWREVFEKTQNNSPVRRLGFDDQQALLPYGPRSFQGYRLLHEYFAFPNRYMFVQLCGLGAGVRRSSDAELDIILLLDRNERFLENSVDSSNFALFCSPAVNLFPRQADRIHLREQLSEFHVLPDRTRPMDFEVYEVTGVVGHGTSAESEQEFLPFYASNDLTSYSDHKAYYALHRVPRVVSSRQRRHGPRSSYIGSEVFVSLVDANNAPFHHELRQLAVSTLCTNRDLPLQMPVGRGRTDFTMESGAPVQSVRCLAGPTKPKPSLAYTEGENAWRLVSHLSLNYLSLLDSDQRQGAAALRDLLILYGDTNEPPIQKQIEGVKSVSSEPITRPLPRPGPRTFGRGMEITVTCDESAFEGSGVFLIGAVLEQFFSKYVSINSFTETVINTIDRGEIIRWPTRIGRRHTL